jgi:hypothetical protein
MAADYTDFWVACAAAGPVLLIPTYLMVRQERMVGSTMRSGLSIGSVAFLAAGTIVALVQLANGTPVHDRLFGRIIELVLICGPVATLVLSLMRMRHPAGTPHELDEMGMPELD